MSRKHKKTQAKAIRESVDYEFAYRALAANYSDSFGTWRPVAILGGRQNRIQGKNLYTNWSEHDLLRQVDLARYLDATNPVAQGAVNKLVSYVLQSGSAYRVIPKNKRVKPPESYLDLGQDVVDEWLEENQWKFEEAEHVRSSIVDGEIYLFKGRDEDTGEATLRRIEPEQLQNPPGATINEGWRLGVQHRLGDVRKVLNYNVNWGLGIPGSRQYGEIVPAHKIIPYKRNVVGSVARGVSDFFSNADDLDKIDKALDAIGAGTIARAKIAYFRKHKDALPGAVEEFQRANATGTFYNPLTQQQERKFVPTDGAVADTPDTIDVATMPQGNTLEAIEAVNLLIRLTIATRWDMPEYIASADSSNNNYASLLASGSPFTMSVRRNQGGYVGVWTEALNWVLRVKVALGQLPADYMDHCKIECTLPDPVVNNEMEAEQIRDIRYRNKILSPQTYAAQARLNYENELQNRRQAMADDPQGAMNPLPGLEEILRDGGQSDTP